MPLRLKLPHGDKILVNGAVLENSGEATVLVFHNRADIMRRKEIMQESEASTPARRVYYALQCAYIFDEKRASYLGVFEEFLSDYSVAAPSSASIVERLRAHVCSNSIYKALREAHALIAHEKQRVDFSQAPAEAEGEAAEKEKEKEKVL